MRRRDESFLADALRADHDLGQGEVDVRKSGQQAVVELRRPRVALPALLPRGDLVDAVLRQGRDQAGKIAVLLRDRVTLPELADLVVDLRFELSPQLLPRLFTGGCGRSVEVSHGTSLHLLPWTSTSSSSAPRGRCRRPGGRPRRCLFAAGASACSSTARGGRSGRCSARRSASSSCARFFLRTTTPTTIWACREC